MSRTQVLSSIACVVAFVSLVPFGESGDPPPYCTGICNPPTVSRKIDNQCGKEHFDDFLMSWRCEGSDICDVKDDVYVGGCAYNEEPTGQKCVTANVPVIVYDYTEICFDPLAEIEGFQCLCNWYVMPAPKQIAVLSCTTTTNGCSTP